MKRKGFLLLEALISLFILTSLALSIFPLATETARVIDSLARRGRLSSEVLSVSERGALGFRLHDGKDQERQADGTGTGLRRPVHVLRSE